MIPLYLNQSAHIVDQICESDVECRPHHSDSSEKLRGVLNFELRAVSFAESLLMAHGSLLAAFLRF